MCGIAGVLGAHDSATVDRQLDTLRHRGPDARGHFSMGLAAAGQNRLSIIDVDGGDPPIYNENRTVAVALNGEIYNFLQLRAELESEGHHFRTLCDTEVLAHLAEDHSPLQLVERLEGMFAFALYDHTRERFLMGRDRLGKKPLYYWTGRDRLVFASEIKGVLADPHVPRRVDPRAIPAFVRFGYVPSPRTFYEDIVSLPPGCILTVEGGRRSVVEQYWRPPLRKDTEPSDITLAEAGAETRRLLEAAVKRRLVADVPLGAFLSGGLDSTAVVACMAAAMTSPVKTFTIGFADGEGYDERPFARLAAERFGTDHHEFVVEPSASDLLEPILWHCDQPFGDSSALPTYLLSRLTREHVTVALAGDGGDELFAGYDRFQAGHLVAKYGLIPRPARAAIEATIGRLRGGSRRDFRARSKRFVEHASSGLPDAFLSWVSLAPASTLQALVGDADGWAKEDYLRAWSYSEGSDIDSRLLHLNLTTYLLDDLLPKVDRMSMAHGLEVRSPFLDRDLVEFALQLPPELRRKGRDGKRVLKAAVGDVVPSAITNRRKRGFALPLARWLRTDLRPLMESLLLHQGSHLSKHIDADGVREVVADHTSGGADLAELIWALMMLECFLRREDA